MCGHAEATVITVIQSKPGTVTIHGRPGEDVRRGTWKSIMRQAGLDEQK